MWVKTGQLGFLKCRKASGNVSFFYFEAMLMTHRDAKQCKAHVFDIIPLEIQGMPSKVKQVLGFGIIVPLWNQGLCQQFPGPSPVSSFSLNYLTVQI